MPIINMNTTANDCQACCVSILDYGFLRGKYNLDAKHVFHDAYSSCYGNITEDLYEDMSHSRPQFGPSDTTFEQYSKILGIKELKVNSKMRLNTHL